jgi:hypothetical protein
LRKGLQESFLRRFFGLAAIAKEPMRNVEYSRAIASNNFRECRFVFRARPAGQFQVGRMFVTVRQKLSFGLRRQSELSAALSIDPTDL